MADRMHPYPMFPQNLAPNSLQQSQIPPQSQQTDPQMISALSNPEHARMWQLQNQLQNQYRSQQSGDLAATQMNHQMQEFARGQALSHGQGQPVVQQIQQSFGLNTQRMNTAGPVFHDPQANQPTSTNFPNVSINTQQPMKGAFNMNPMINNPGVPRQLKILNQQQEMARLQQAGLTSQHGSNQPTAVEMFASSSMHPSQDQMHGSPHTSAQPVGPPGTNQGMAPGNLQATAQKRLMTPSEFHERKNYLGTLITQSEMNLASLMQTARSASSIEPSLQQKITHLRTEVARQKEMYSKFVVTFGAMVTQQIMDNPSNVSHLNPMAHSVQQQPPQQTAISNPQVQPAFFPQTNQPYKFPTANAPSPMPPQGQGSLNQQIPIQPTQIGRPNTIPPRTGGTPHQISGGPNTMSPSLGTFAVQGGQKVPDQPVLPLDKQRFESAYSQFCRSLSINPGSNPGSRIQIGDNRTVDLHQLHSQVMREGGAASVSQRDMWAVIGGRLGFIQFPGNDSEPARSGPGIAQQLHNTYDQYLQHFESAYIFTVKSRPPAGPQQPPIHQVNPTPHAIGNNAASGISGNPAEVPPNPQRSLPNSQIIAAASRYAFASAQEMRAQHVPDYMIAFVERHRADLVMVYQQQVQRINAKKNAEQEQQNIANTQGSFPNMHEQTSVGLQPGVQRPPQPIGPSPMVNITGESKMENGSFVPENIGGATQTQPPTREQVQHAHVMINQIKYGFQQRLAGMGTQQIADELRQDFHQLLEQVYRMSSELDGKLPVYFAVLKNEEVIRKSVAIVLTVARQRQLLATTSSPQYIVSIATLRNMQFQIHKLNQEFESHWRAIKSSSAANSQHHTSLTPARLNPGASLSVPPTLNISQVIPSASRDNGRPPAVNPSPQQPLPQSQLQPPPSQSQSLPNQPQSHPHLPQQLKKNFQPSMPRSPSAAPPPATLTSPTPSPAVAAASSSTPATSAPTPQPSYSSPQTPKSPPSKAPPKTKGSTRVNRKMSTASRGPATPETVPAVAGAKRPPEEDVASLTNVAPSEAEMSNAPSPKKARTEWEGEASDVLLKRQQEIENIKTDEDAATFFDRMKELFAMSASTDNEMNHGIATTLDQILAGVAQEPADAAATAAALALHSAGDAGVPPTVLSPHLGPANDAFLEFIDLSSFPPEDEDSDSKAPTPDLVPSSETNPSPESGSEGDLLGSTGSPDKTKIDEPGDRSDPLRLGSLREIDGGESAYYQGGDWKWEGPMPTLDQPWAIFTS